MNAVVVNLPSRAQVTGARSIPDRAEYVARLYEILAAVEADDQALFESRLNQLMRQREDGLFVNLAKLTRELRQAVQDLNFDERLQQLAGSEIPDACVRLNHVVKLGEDAAHRTLDMVDSSRPLIDAIDGCARDLGEVRDRMLRCAETPPPIFGLRQDLEAVQRKLRQAETELRANFSAISQAQEYQDLSGQVIRRVVTLVQNVEGALIKLLRATNEGFKNPGSRPLESASDQLAGPSVPGLDLTGASQQDADALLAELGF